LTYYNYPSFSKEGWPRECGDGVVLNLNHLPLTEPSGVLPSEAGQALLFKGGETVTIYITEI
jgi:hypothetical protein